MLLSAGVPPGHGGDGRAVWVGQPSIAGGEGQQRTAPAGRHGRSISSKQGKLIPGPSTLLRAVNTALQPDRAPLLRASGAGHCRRGLSTAQAGSGRGTRRAAWLPREGEVGAQAEELAERGRQGQQLCSCGDEQSLGTAQPPLAGEAHWDAQQLGCLWGEGEKRDADKQFHRERSPPLILSQHSGKAAAGVHATLDALAGCTRCTTDLGMPLAPCCGRRNGCQAAPAASTTPSRRAHLPSGST